MEDTNDECKFEMNKKVTYDSSEEDLDWSVIMKDQVSFDPGGAFLTDVEVEFPEASKLILITFVRNLNVTPNTQGDVYRLRKKLKWHAEYSGTDCSTLLDMHPLMAIRVFFL
ncbi:hypothetical protein Tco_1207922 [Tanacetum coccineum]